MGRDRNPVAAAGALRAASLLLGCAALAGAQAAPEGLAERAARLVRSGLQQGTSEEGIVRSLTDLGPEASAALVRLAVGAFELPPAEARSGRPVANEPLRRRTLCVRALARVPERAVLLELEGHLFGEAEPPVRRAAIELLGELGTARSLGLWKRAAALGADGRDGDPLTRAAAGILARDPAAIGHLATGFEHETPPWAPFAVAAIGSQPSREGADLLARVLGRSSELDLEILKALGRISEKRWIFLDDEALARVRAYLGSHVDMLVAAAARALGGFDDADAIPELIQLLGHPDSRLESAAARALLAIGEVKLDGAGAWTSFYEKELEWVRVERPRHLQRLRSSNPAVAMAAIEALCQRRLFRHALADDLRGLLAHRDGLVAAHACAGLAVLGSPRAVPDLLKALDGQDPRLAAAAADALTRITGLRLGTDPQAWACVRP